MRRASLCSLLLLLACSSAPETPPLEQPKRTWQFRALSGVSMGAIGSAWLVGENDGFKKVDAVGLMGGPVDGAYFMSNMERNLMGGFCPRAQLEALAAEDGTKLNDPAALDCTSTQKFLGYELHQNFNAWSFTTNGGTFDRDSYLEIFEDLALAMGNPFWANESSGLFPVPELTREKFNASLCDNPIVLEGFRNAEYNPEGTYPVITFCDGEEQPLYCDDAAKTPVDYCSEKTPEQFCRDLGGTKTLKAGKLNSQNPDLYYAKMGRYDPCFQHRMPVAFGLAVDFNRNGRRDFHEPVISNARERFQDVGTDGCANDREDGKGGCTATGASGDPNGDDFGIDTNPLGTEGNYLHDENEPFDDFGLDGVAGTGDSGEGNGTYDMSANRRRVLARDLRQRYLRMTADERRQFDVYIDGGVRDVFNLGLSGDHVHSAMRVLDPDAARRYTSFLAIPEITGKGWTNGFYDAQMADYGAIGRKLFIRYGSDSPTDKQRRDGDGDHVGDGAQLLGRFGTYLKWISHVWTPVLGEPSPILARGRREERTYFSEKLGALRNYGIALPPGYDLPENKDRHYPIVFLLHGYGMEAGAMSDLNILIDEFTSSGEMRDMILVYPSGKCCFRRPDGTKDCRELDDDHITELEDKPGYVRECNSGNFFVDRVGEKAGDTTLYGQSLWELMDRVATEERALAPITQ